MAAAPTWASTGARTSLGTHRLYAILQSLRASTSSSWMLRDERDSQNGQLSKGGARTSLPAPTAGHAVRSRPYRTSADEPRSTRCPARLHECHGRRAEKICAAQARRHARPALSRTLICKRPACVVCLALPTHPQLRIESMVRRLLGVVEQGRAIPVRSCSFIRHETHDPARFTSK